MWVCQNREEAMLIPKYEQKGISLVPDMSPVYVYRRIRNIRPIQTHKYDDDLGQTTSALPSTSLHAGNMPRFPGVTPTFDRTTCVSGQLLPM